LTASAGSTGIPGCCEELVLAMVMVAVRPRDANAAGIQVVRAASYNYHLLWRKT
jgi:hypothetical protein